MLFRKNDIITSLSTSLLFILIQNPFSITDIGLILSFTATLGIIFFNKIILSYIEKFKLENTDTINKENENIIKTKNSDLLDKMCTKIKEIIAISLSVQIFILPITIVIFNKISLTFLLSNILVSFLIGTIIILGFISIIIPFRFLFIILNIMLNMLNNIANFFSNIPLSKMTVITPNAAFVLVYYTIIIIILYIHFLKKKETKRFVEKKILTNVDRFKCLILEKKKIIIISIISIFIIMHIINLFPKDLRIHFIDVGQGDSSLIITPKGETILIDGGGGKLEDDFDVGKNTLLPYLLDRKITRINYIIVSHFDSDHCNGLIAVLENIKVDSVVISKQSQISSEYTNITEIIKEKKIEVKVIKAGDKLILDNDVTLEILYPEKELKFSDINNNSIVARLEYKGFSALFTGDIEKEAENVLINNYKNTNKLKSTVLKVAHHGSKTSSIEKFIKEVNPKIALIRCWQK